jgi:hypothetical protein
MSSSSVIDLAEIRAARGNAVFASAMASVKQEDLFEALERRTATVSAAAELMVSGMNRFINELDTLLDDTRVARDFCTACQEAWELEDVDAMVESRDRLRAEFEARMSQA